MILTLTDKNGIEIPTGSVIYGPVPERLKPKSKEKHYFNFGYGPTGKEFEMIACTYGYVHNVQQTDVADFEYIGPLKENLHLLECD